MILCIIIPSEDYRNFAGSRIRYGRIGSGVSEDCDIRLLCITDFDPEETEGDVFLISKCHDALSVVCASILSARGKIVGVDLFDDYFSQCENVRLSKFRNWLTSLLPFLNFVLCSTERMSHVVSAFSPGLPVHVMNDPARNFNDGGMSELLASKILDATTSRTIRVAWFGVGDNPNFKVGLSDLAHFGSALSALAGDGWFPILRILTNARAMTADNLAKLLRLPIPYSVNEWTEEEEQSLLAESLAAFIPVNCQNFSVAKSLNRAVTAMNAGCQIVSNGYPLYDKLAPFIYRSAAEFKSDLEAGTLRFRSDSIPRYVELMDNYASGVGETQSLLRFLANLDDGSIKESRALTDIAVLHGISTSGLAHKVAKRVGVLSVASPTCSAALGFDVIFRRHIRTREMVMLISSRAISRIDREARKRLFEFGKVGTQEFFSWDVPVRAEQGEFAPVTAPSEQMAFNNDWLLRIRAELAATFGITHTIVSDNSNMPIECPRGMHDREGKFC